MRNVYKLQLCIEDEGDTEFRDFYFDVNKITGWYLPHGTGWKGINIMFNGDLVTIRQEPHILAYLKNRFGDVCITKENYNEKVI